MVSYTFDAKTLSLTFCGPGVHQLGSGTRYHEQAKQWHPDTCKEESSVCGKKFVVPAPAGPHAILTVWKAGETVYQCGSLVSAFSAFSVRFTGLGHASQTLFVPKLEFQILKTLCQTLFAFCIKNSV